MSSLRWHFVLGTDLSSKLIAWWGQAYGGWSHVDAILRDGTLLGARSDSVGGKPPGVQIRPVDYAKWTRRTIIELPCTPYEADTWEAFLRSQVGCGYDKADILGLILGKPLMTAGHWICSALQLDALEVIHRIPKIPLTPQQCPPNMLAAGLQFLGATTRNL